MEPPKRPITQVFLTKNVSPKPVYPTFNFQRYLIAFVDYQSYYPLMIFLGGKPVSFSVLMILILGVKLYKFLKIFILCFYKTTENGM